MAGLIAALAHLGSPDNLGPNLAISLMTLMYSIVISFFVFFPTQAWAENKIKTFQK
jgi:flagellar motor component MotA